MEEYRIRSVRDTADDRVVTRKWANDPETIKWSYSRTGEVGVEEHREWFDERYRLVQEGQPWWIVEVRTKSGVDPVGQLRLDLRGLVYKDVTGYHNIFGEFVSVYLEPVYRGIGLATQMVTLLTYGRRRDRVFALINPKNESSMKLFSNCHYRYHVSGVDENWVIMSSQY